ncbi:MAG: 3'-5' exonuclease [Xanthobacteraceae bacterium]
MTQSPDIISWILPVWSTILLTRLTFHRFSAGATLENDNSEHLESLDAIFTYRLRFDGKRFGTIWRLRILRRLVPRLLSKPPLDNSRIAIVIDFETTGLNTAQDEVIEIGMVKFSCSDQGEVTAVIDTFGSLNEPSTSIPPEITALTGITDDMVRGQHINPDAVVSFVSNTNVVIAHNANFDQKFAERGWPIFIGSNWTCSAQEIEWRKHGFEGSRLAYLLAGAGYFHDAHRAVDDCQAQWEILAMRLAETNATALLQHPIELVQRSRARPLSGVRYRPKYLPG